MRHKTAKILLFSVLILLCSLSIAYATDDDEGVSLASFPQRLEAALGFSSVGHFAGGILATLILQMLFILPVTVATKGGNIPLLIIFGFSTMGFAVAIGWMPVWVLLVISVIVGLMFAGAMRDLITGKGR